MTPKILIINGSPRKNGLTAGLCTLLKKEIEKQMENRQYDIELLHISSYTIKPCTGCDVCLRKPNTCPLSKEDDMNKLEEILSSSDVIIIGAPSYFASVPSQLKVLMDRTRPLKMQKYKLKNRLFSFMTTSGLVAGGTNVIQNALMQFALIHGMIVYGALGHPVIMGNFVQEFLQKQGIKEFRKPSDWDDIGEIAKTVVSNLAQRTIELLEEKKN